MARKMPSLPASLKDLPTLAARLTSSTDSKWKLPVRLVTPLFGGGHTAGKGDPVTPISAKAIRGQLRFWWRATRGTRITSTAELQEQEGRIFGTTERASLLNVAVASCIPERPDPVRCGKYVQRPNTRGELKWRLEWDAPFSGRDNPLPYVAFPFQGRPPDNPKPKEPAAFYSNLETQITIAVPKEYKTDVRAALWGWLNFGGLGSRTRRGCGALFCPDFSPDSAANIETWFNKAVREFDMDESARREWPTIGQISWHEQETNQAIDAWKRSIRPFVDFRQSPAGVGNGMARNPGDGNRPGRSRWPEPESIRRATGRRSGKHDRLPAIPDDAFPRAEFGLPIIFHFAPIPQGNPPDTEIYPVVGGARMTRMASPLILRPLQLMNGRCIPIALRLQTPELTHCQLVRNANDPEPIEEIGAGGIRDPRLADYSASPMRNPKTGVRRSEVGSAIDAFLAFLTEDGFRSTR